MGHFFFFMRIRFMKIVISLRLTASRNFLFQSTTDRSESVMEAQTLGAPQRHKATLDIHIIKSCKLHVFDFQERDFQHSFFDVNREEQ